MVTISFCIFFQLISVYTIMSKLPRRLQVSILLVNPKAFYLSTFFWVCRIWDCALLPSPHPCSSFGFHIFTRSPVLFLGSLPIPFLFLYSPPLLLFFLSSFSSPSFRRMKRHPGSAFNCLSYIFALLFRVGFCSVLALITLCSSPVFPVAYGISLPALRTSHLKLIVARIEYIVSFVFK